MMQISLFNIGWICLQLSFGFFVSGFIIQVPTWIVLLPMAIFGGLTMLILLGVDSDTVTVGKIK